MSQNLTLSAVMSATQALALGALASGLTVTKAAEKAGVARETVSRWLHHDPVFIAELQTVRAELAVQTRCALEALGMQSVGVLRDAIQDNFVKPGRLRAACALLRLLGAHRPEAMPAMTAEEAQVRLQERDAELQKRRAKLDATVNKGSRCVDVTPDSEGEKTSSVEPPQAAAGGQSVTEDHTVATEQTAPAPALKGSRAVGELGRDDKGKGVGSHGDPLDRLIEVSGGITGGVHNPMHVANHLEPRHSMMTKT
jgi:hypothetical protein